MTAPDQIIRWRRGSSRLPLRLARSTIPEWEPRALPLKGRTPVTPPVPLCFIPTIERSMRRSSRRPSERPSKRSSRGGSRRSLEGVDRPNAPPDAQGAQDAGLRRNVHGLHGPRDRDGLAARRRNAHEDGLPCAASGPAPLGSTRGDQHQDDVGRCAPVVQSWTNRRNGVQSEGSWARC